MLLTDPTTTTTTTFGPGVSCQLGWSIIRKQGWEREEDDGSGSSGIGEVGGMDGSTTGSR